MPHSTALSIPILWLSLALAISPAQAQDTPSSTDPPASSAAALDTLYIDFSVPDLTAFTLLGVDGSSISRPGSVRELTAALTNGFSTFNEQGVGLEFAPFQLGEPPSLGSYNGLVDRLSVSLAAVQEAEGARFGLGFRWVPIDRSDPYESTELKNAVTQLLSNHSIAAELEVRQSLASSISQFLGPRFRTNRAGFTDVNDLFDFDDPNAKIRTLSADSAQAYVLQAVKDRGVQLSAPDALLLESYVREFRATSALLDERFTAIDASLNTDVQKAKDAFRENTWNSLAIQLAGGLTLRTPNEIDNVDFQYLGGFASVAAPLFGKTGQLIAHAQVNATLNDSTDTRASIGGRMLLGSSTRRLSLEGLYGSNDERLGGERFRFLVGGEIRLSDGVYLELATGINLPENGDSGFLTLGSLRYGLSKEPRFVQPRK